MPVRITNKEYKLIHDDFNESFNWLFGNVGSVLELDLDFNVEFSAESSSSNPFTFYRGVVGDVYYDRLEGSFVQDGFKAGDTVNFSVPFTDTGGTTTIETGSFTIESVTATRMFVDGAGGTGTSQVYPSVRTDGSSYGNVTLTSSLNTIEGVEIDLNLIPTDIFTTGSPNSVIDGSPVRFRAKDIDGIGVPLNQLGNKSGFSFIDGSVVDNGGGDYTASIKFRIPLQFEDIENITELTFPDWFEGQSTLSDYILIRAFPEFNNPNANANSNWQEIRLLGNTGWFNESYNQGNQPYSVTSASYTDTSFASVNNLLIGDDTLFTFVIDAVGADASTKINFGCFYLPQNNDQYKNNEFTNDENIFLNPFNDSLSLEMNQGYASTVDNYGKNGGLIDISGLSITLVGSVLTITGTLSFNTELTNYLLEQTEDNRNFAFYVTIGNPSADSVNLQDRTTLLLDSLGSEVVIPSLGMANLSSRFLKHNEDTTGLGVANPEVWVEDNLLAKHSYNYLKTDGELVNQVIKIEAKRISDGALFDLESETLDYSNVVSVDDIKQINLRRTRSFNQNIGDEAKGIISSVLISSDASGANYEILYPFRIRWEYWIANPDLSDDFYDINEPNNGLNQDWVRIFNNAGYEIQYNIYTTVSNNGVLGQYSNPTTIEIFDYEESTELVTDDFATYKVDDTPIPPIIIDGVENYTILGDQDTKIVANFTLQNTVIDQIAQYWGKIELDPPFGGENSERYISSVSPFTVESGNPLKPLSGQDRLFLEQISANQIRLTALIDYTKMPENFGQWKLTARLQCGNLI